MIVLLLFVICSYCILKAVCYFALFCWFCLVLAACLISGVGALGGEFVVINCCLGFFTFAGY